MSNQGLLNRLSAFADSPHGLAFVDTLGFAEGADYDTIQGYVGRVKSWDDHPRVKGPLSDAAGKPQFLSTTWDTARGALGLPDFSPRSQRIAAAYLADRRLERAGLGGVEAIQQNGITPEIAAALAPEWASFPTRSGKSYYGQPVKSLNEIQRVFQDKLNSGGNGQATPISEGAASQDDSDLKLLQSIFGGGGLAGPGMGGTQASLPGLGLEQFAVPGLEAAGNPMQGLGTGLGIAALGLPIAAGAAGMFGNRMAGGNASVRTLIADQQLAGAHGAIAQGMGLGAPRFAGAANGIRPLTTGAQNGGGSLFENLMQAAMGGENPAGDSGPAMAGAQGGRIPGGATTRRTRDPDAEATGWDIVHPGGRGAPILAPVDLTITGTGFQGQGAGETGRGYGNWVSGEFELGGKKHELLIGHFDDIEVKPGMRLPRGGRIGRQGITGRTFGTHATTHVNPRGGASVDDAWNALDQLTRVWEGGT